jgi:hypothetical protein
MLFRVYQPDDAPVIGLIWMARSGSTGEICPNAKAIIRPSSGVIAAGSRQSFSTIPQHSNDLDPMTQL